MTTPFLEQCLRAGLQPVQEQDAFLPPAPNCLWACDLALQTCGLSPEVPTKPPTVPTCSGPRGYCWGQNEGGKKKNPPATTMTAIKGREQRRGHRRTKRQRSELGVINSGDWCVCVGGGGQKCEVCFLTPSSMPLLSFHHPHSLLYLSMFYVSPLEWGLPGPNN